MSLQFFTNAAVVATLLPHYPHLKDRFELSNSGFGLMVVAFAVGSVLTAAWSGQVLRRFGAMRVATVGTVLVSALVAVAASSPWFWLLFVALFLAGTVDPVLDAGQNVHGLRVERALGRSIINSLHAVWSLGAVVGGLVGAWTAGLGLPVGPVLVVSAVVWSCVAVLAGWLARLPGEDDHHSASEERTTGRRGALLLVAPFAALAISGALVEEIGNSWAALYTRDALGAAPGVAGLAYVAAYAAQFVGRLLGDVATDRLGRGRTAATGGLLIAAGALVTMLAPGVAAVMVGFVLLGLGCSTLIPAAFAAAHDLRGLPYGTGVGLVTWLMRTGFLLTSPVYGVVADSASLRAGMVLPLLAGVAAVIIAVRWLSPRATLAR